MSKEQENSMHNEIESAPATAGETEGIEGEERPTEWTIKYVERLMQCVGPALTIKDTHNAALAAERRANRGLYIESNERKRQLDAAVEAIRFFMDRHGDDAAAFYKGKAALAKIKEGK